ncbi:Response regulator PleD [compost metagenome]
MNHTLLVVDDNPNNVRLLQDILEDEVFTVCTASRGDQVLELARDMRPDAILLDIMMPGIDGFEVCRILKQEYLTQDIPVLMVTAKTEGSDLEKSAGARGFRFHQEADR